MKKGQGLPISTVILAALGLVILVVLFAVTTGRLGIFSQGISKCPTTCESVEVCENKQGTPLPGKWLTSTSPAVECSKPLVCCSIK